MDVFDTNGLSDSFNLDSQLHVAAEHTPDGLHHGCSDDLTQALAVAQIPQGMDPQRRSFRPSSVHC